MKKTTGSTSKERTTTRQKSESKHPQNRMILHHEGKKYLRTIEAADSDGFVNIDVYAVLVAFNVVCPVRAHAIKKLFCAGTRGKGSALDDLVGALAAFNRAIDLEKKRMKKDQK